ncbi:hypothetical protein ACGFNU_44785 [Spirillospora sp. NPDC048911]|uniref:hypothetical protein n=1 Tax=Spirillospora sp. NPDC048911 TaxID=3364527 RepID=UPI00371B26DF
MPCAQLASDPKEHDERPGDEQGRHIFRFDPNGKIVEHWDVLQTIPSASKNDNSMF